MKINVVYLKTNSLKLCKKFMTFLTNLHINGPNFQTPPKNLSIAQNGNPPVNTFNPN